MTTKTEGICGQRQADGTICMNAAGCAIPHPPPRSDLSATQTQGTHTQTGGYGEDSSDHAPPPQNIINESRNWDDGGYVVFRAHFFNPRKKHAEDTAHSMMREMAAAMTERGHTEAPRLHPDEREHCDDWLNGHFVSEQRYRARNRRGVARQFRDAAALFNKVALDIACSHPHPRPDTSIDWSPGEPSQVVAGLTLERILRGEHPPSDAWNAAWYDIVELWERMYDHADNLWDGEPGSDYDDSMREQFEWEWESLTSRPLHLYLNGPPPRRGEEG